MSEKISVENIGALKVLTDKHFAKEQLGLSSMEVSVNRLPAGTGVPFVHTHKMNEELYVVVSGEGMFYADGEEFELQEGTLVRVAPAVERAIRAGKADLCYICIQAAENSLRQYTMTDGVISETKTAWMK